MPSFRLNIFQINKSSDRVTIGEYISSYNDLNEPNIIYVPGYIFANLNILPKKSQTFSEEIDGDPL